MGTAIIKQIIMISLAVQLCQRKFEPYCLWWRNLNPYNSVQGLCTTKGCAWTVYECWLRSCISTNSWNIWSTWPLQCLAARDSLHSHLQGCWIPTTYLCAQWAHGARTLSWAAVTGMTEQRCDSQLGWGCAGISCVLQWMFSATKLRGEKKKQWPPGQRADFTITIHNLPLNCHSNKVRTQVFVTHKWTHPVWLEISWERILTRNKSNNLFKKNLWIIHNSASDLLWSKPFSPPVQGFGSFWHPWHLPEDWEPGWLSDTSWSSMQLTCKATEGTCDVILLCKYF